MGEVLLAPLGGLNEFGLNVLAVEAADGMILVDCGLMVDAPGVQGVDYWIPDFTYLRAQRDKLLAVLLTHGHDDHIGGVPHLIDEFPVPVYGTPYTLELLEPRIEEICPSRRNLLRRMEVGGTGQVGSFGFEFLRVPHSVPDACAVVVQTPGGTVLCTGDFKLDPTPVDGRSVDEASLARWRERGVDLLCCDSTNVARPGETPSERSVGSALRDLFPLASGRIYLSTFSSHVHRIQQVLETSRGVGRSVTFLGRSLAANVRSARRLGHLKVAPGDIVSETKASTLPRGRVTVVLAGAQGEAGSALRRVVGGDLPRYRLLPGDEVFLSSRVIPGYERSVGRLIDRCLEQGARVHVGEEAGVHVSGHPSEGDVLRLFDLVAPAHVLPVHGKRRQREALSALARRWGLPDEKVHLVVNGQAVLLKDGRVCPGPRVPFGRTFVENGRVGADGDLLLKDRARLGRRGVAAAMAVVRPDGALVWGPRVALRGVLPSAAAEQGEREAERALRALMTELCKRRMGVPELEVELQAALRRHLRKFFSEVPLVLVQVAEVDSGNGAPLK